MKFFDVHTHVQFAAFKDDWQEVIKRALGAGVSLINIGTQKDTSARAVEFAKEFPSGVYATVGLHPIHTEKSYHDPQELGAPPLSTISNSRELENNNKKVRGFTSREEEFDYDYYKKLALEPKVVAIGECGLDYYRLGQGANREAQIAKQKTAFLKQIELSLEVEKPLMIHCREAFSDLISMLNDSRQAFSDLPGVVHFFTGTINDAKKLLDLGFSFTFGGAITFARNYDEIIKLTPLNRILSETDAPYLAPAPHRGQRNEPAYVIEVVKKLAEIKSLSEEKMAEQILENSQRIFGIA